MLLGIKLSVFDTGNSKTRLPPKRNFAPCGAAISVKRTIQKAKLAKIVNALIALTEVS